jgi:hypothetical protein
MKRLAITVAEMNTIICEIIAGAPLSIDTEAGREMRARLEPQIKKLQREGTIVALPAELDPHRGRRRRT